MADYTNIQHGDLDDAAAVSVLVGHQNLADYVAFGLEPSVTSSASPPTLSLTAGKAFILLNTQNAPGAGHEKHDCLVTAHYEARDGISLPYSGVNYVWAFFQMGTNDSPKIRVTGEDTRPSADSLKIAEVDVDNESESVTSLNRLPSGEFDLLTTDRFWVNEAITWPDGQTTNTHPIAYGETIDNPNDYYDNSASDPPGVVSQAADATNAEQAQQAQNATHAEQAGNADTLDGYEAEELLNRAESLRAQPWDPLYDDVQVSDSYDSGPSITFDTSDYDYDQYRVRLHTQNDHAYTTGLGCYLNGIDSHNYNIINLLPDQGEVAWRTGTDTWTVGSTMARSHAMQEFFIGLPDPIVDQPPPRQYPVFNAGNLQTGMVRSYELAGNLTQSVESIDEILIETGDNKLTAEAQVYGQNYFPEQENGI